MAAYNDFIVDLFVSELRGCSKVLDFGAGTGTLSLLYRKKTGISLVCVEVDKELAPEEVVYVTRC